ncbi:MAG: hypothetical protein ACLQAT_01060 [Candidatus Binataceae bacterium]
MTREDARIDADPVVRQVASKLGIRSSASLREAITEVAVKRVADQMRRVGYEPTGLDDVHEFVLNLTGVKIVRVQTSAELVAASTSIKTANPTLREQLEFEFARDTEAVVVRRSDADAKSASRFVAIIDARPERQNRAWFAERHEPSHILIDDPGANALWRRTKVKRPEPIERVVDAVASAVGFWKPLVGPALASTLQYYEGPLAAFEAVRQALAPSASKEATYRALAELFGKPLVLLRADYSCRAEDREPPGDPRRSWALRAQTVILNSRARAAGIKIWDNFRIPPHSVIRTEPGTRSQIDNMGIWESERHGTLPPCQVRVTAIGSWAAIEPF